MNAPLKLFIIHHSGRGHTARQAEAVREGALRAGADVTFLTAAQATDQLDSIDGADAIILGSPTYLGSASAELKRFMEASSAKWAAEAWKDKVAAGFTTSGTPSGDKVGTLMQMVLFAAQHGMIWVSLGQLPGHAASTSDPIGSTNRLGVWLGAGGR